MNKNILIAIIMIISVSLFSCSKEQENNETETETMFMLVDKTNTINSTYVLVYYDTEGECKLITEEGDEPYDIYKNNLFYLHINDIYYHHLPKDIKSYEFYIIRDSASFEQYYSYRLDTIYRIIKNAKNIIEITDDIKDFPIDRQDPTQYPEIIKDIIPFWFGN